MPTSKFKHKRNILLEDGGVCRRVGKLIQVFKNREHDFYFQTPYSATDPHQGTVEHLSLHETGMSHVKFLEGRDVLHSKANALAFKEIGYAAYFQMEFKLDILPVELVKTDADIVLEWKSDHTLAWLVAHFVDVEFAINNRIGFGALLHDPGLVPIFNASLVDTKAIAVGGTEETSKKVFVVQCGYKETVAREDKILFQPIKGQYKKDYLLASTPS
jgi:hypothetical protein